MWSRQGRGRPRGDGAGHGVGSGPGTRGARSRSGQRGMVTAETAMVLPLLVVLTIGLAWLVSLGVAQARAVDAARETARALARDDPAADALALGRRVAPEGSRIEVSRAGGRVVVVVSADSRGPGGLFGSLPLVRIRAEAVAAAEDP